MAFEQSVPDGGASCGLIASVDSSVDIHLYANKIIRLDPGIKPRARCDQPCEDIKQQG
jgi:hypothetical protein